MRTGEARLFRDAEVTAEALLASACLPQVFPAVEIDGEAYWDGGYASNPPLRALVEAGAPADIVLVRTTPVERPDPPAGAAGVLERADEMVFAAALRQELRSLAVAQRLLADLPSASAGRVWRGCATPGCTRSAPRRSSARSRAAASATRVGVPAQTCATSATAPPTAGSASTSPTSGCAPRWTSPRSPVPSSTPASASGSAPPPSRGGVAERRAVVPGVAARRCASVAAAPGDAATSPPLATDGPAAPRGASPRRPCPPGRRRATAACHRAAADTASIVVMEIVDNAIMLAAPGAMEAGLADLLLWASLALALLVAAVAAFPANRWLIAFGRGDAVVVAHHGHHH